MIWCAFVELVEFFAARSPWFIIVSGCWTFPGMMCSGLERRWLLWKFVAVTMMKSKDFATTIQKLQARQI
eukprot:s5343_g6.t1